MNKPEIGPMLKRMRQQQGFTVAQVARALHVSTQAVYNWEQPAANPRLSTLLRYCEIIGVRLEITT